MNKDQYEKKAGRRLSYTCCPIPGVHCWHWWPSNFQLYTLLCPISPQDNIKHADCKEGQNEIYVFTYIHEQVTGRTWGRVGTFIYSSKIFFLFLWYKNIQQVFYAKEKCKRLRKATGDGFPRKDIFCTYFMKIRYDKYLLRQYKYTNHKASQGAHCQTTDLMITFIFSYIYTYFSVEYNSLKTFNMNTIWRAY